MYKKFVFVVLFIAGVSVFTACKTGLFGGDLPASKEPAPPPAPVVVDGMRTSYADVVDKTSPAVVRIEADHKSKPQPQMQSPFDFGPFGAPQQPQNQGPQVQRGLGSGVIVSADGTILTNNHVVDGAEKIIVQLSDNKSFEAKLVGTDKLSDLAVIKIEATNMPFLNLGNSDAVRIGDIVLAIGNPLGIGQTVTAGIISAKGRRTGLSDGSFEDFLQTDAPINRGNSGGALVNLNGELIGINSQILSPGGANGGNIGIGFSIPSNMAKSVLEQLLKDGKVRRGMLGIGIQDLTEDMAKTLDLKDTSGVLVGSLRTGGAAEKAGLQRRDVITAINGEKIDNGNILRNKVAGTAPGSEIKLTVIREGKEQEFTVKLDELDNDSAKKDDSGDDEEKGGPAGESGKLGLSLQPLTPQSARQLGLPAGSEGMVVTDIDRSGVAAEAGIQPGDVILEINKKTVKTNEDVKDALAAGGDRPVLLLIGRKDQTIYLTIRPR
jgi:serine protease Do